jgi:hypothetical protein
MMQTAELCYGLSTFLTWYAMKWATVVMDILELK